MKLTSDQIRAATACGCVLTPASENQVGRLTMQRRIFSLDGKPFVAERNGVFETHGTLEALITNYRPTAVSGKCTEGNVGQVLEVQRAQEAEVPPAQVASVSGETTAADVAVPPPTEPETAPAEQKVPRRAATKRRTVTAPVTASAKAAVEESSIVAETALPKDGSLEASNALTSPTAIEATIEGEPEARAAGRPRPGQPAPPRWQIAGKLRRGRPT